MLRVVDSASGEEAQRDGNGAFIVFDQREYLVESLDGSLQAHPPVLKLQAIGNIGQLAFDNYVGLAELHGERFRVRHGKLTEGAFEQMLDVVVSQVADLAFDFDTPTSTPSRSDENQAVSIAYHALAYLRHIMRRADQGERLLGQFFQISAHPHRRLEREPTWIPTAHASNISTRGLLMLVSHPEQLQPVDPSSRLLAQGSVRPFLHGRCFPPLSCLSADWKSSTRTKTGS